MLQKGSHQFHQGIKKQISYINSHATALQWKNGQAGPWNTKQTAIDAER